MPAGFWNVVVALGPILLGAAIAWAMWNNRTSRRQLERTEQATRDLYDGETTDRQGH